MEDESIFSNYGKSVMPWQIKHGSSGCKGYAVVKESDGSLVGCHPTKTAAMAHMKALYASESQNKTQKSILKGE